MSTIKYIALCKLLLQHNYYSNGECRALSLMPSDNTATALQRLGLKWLPKSTGGELYGKVVKDGVNWRLPNKLPNPMHLQFFLTDSAGTFLSITQIPAGFKPGQLMVFSNLNNNLFNARPLLVKNTGTHFFSQQDLVEKAQGSYSFSKDAAAPATIRLQNQNTGQILEVESPLYKGKVSASFNLVQADAGFTDLLVNSVIEKTIYVLPANAPGKVMGVVDIFYKDSLPTDYQFMSATGIVNTRTYLIPFATAQARFRYKVQRLFNENLTAVSVEKINPGAIAFNTITGAEPGSFISTSSTAIGLREEPIKGILLKNQSNKIIIPNLPNPSIAQIVTDTDGLLYADMLVTV
ncbi:hypothetical protein BH10BAC3_BH10BAC3_08560 [soil metagenome]